MPFLNPICRTCLVHWIFLFALPPYIWSQFEHLPASFMTLNLVFIYASLVLTLCCQWGCTQVAIVSVYMLTVFVLYMCAWVLSFSEPFSNWTMRCFPCGKLWLVAVMCFKWRSFSTLFAISFSLIHKMLQRSIQILEGNISHTHIRRNPSRYETALDKCTCTSV